MASQSATGCKIVISPICRLIESANRTRMPLHLERLTGGPPSRVKGRGQVQPGCRNFLARRGYRTRVRRTSRRRGNGFAEQVAGDVQKGGAPTLFWDRLEISLDEDLDGLVAVKNLDTNRCVAKTHFMASSVLPSNDGVRHRLTQSRRLVDQYPSSEMPSRHRIAVLCKKTNRRIPKQPGEPRIAQLGSQNGFLKPLDGLQRPYRIAVEVIGEPKIKPVACHYYRCVAHDGTECGHVPPVLAVVLLDCCFEFSISLISAHVPSLGGYRHQSQPRACQQRSDKKGLGYGPLRFAAQVGLERSPVRRLSGESMLTGLVLLLSGGRRHDGRDDCLVRLESFGEVLSDQRRDLPVVSNPASALWPFPI